MTLQKVCFNACSTGKPAYSVQCVRKPGKLPWHATHWTAGSAKFLMDTATLAVAA